MPPLLFFLLAVASLGIDVCAQPFDYPSANVSTLWTNSASHPHRASYPDGSAIRAVLLRSNPAGFGPSFAAGFFCRAAPCSIFLFAIVVVYTDSSGRMTNPTLGIPQVVWTANREHPVQENATLSFTGDGDLALWDADNGGLAWSTNTSGQSVARMALMESGNLVLLDRGNKTLWQSFDHPADSLVLGQSLVEGMTLKANLSTMNLAGTLFYLTVRADGLHAFVKSDPPQLYYKYTITGAKSGNRSTYLTFMNGSLAIFALFTQPAVPDIVISLPPAQSVQYMRLESDGHLRLYEWRTEWTMVKDVLAVPLDDCGYPTVCGKYGICSSRQCSCPLASDGNSSYFRPVDDQRPNLGCLPVMPITCQSVQDHQLLALANVSYFNYRDADAIALQGTDKESCKQACLRNCTCKAALFQYGANASHGSCFLPSQLFSLQTNQPEITHYNSSAYLKVQITTSPPSPNAPSSRKKGLGTGVMLGSTLASVSALLLVVITAVLWVRRKRYQEGDEEDNFDQLSGMPTRFSFAELRVATEDFSKKLGEGGFGSVFEGKLGDERIAVKRLEGASQGKKEFLAEVETIGSIHHINLVRLIGFCADRMQRLLVYEYMPKGSLDKWIYYKDNNVPLDWQTRCRIVLNIAKGLCYLHEECRRRIAHLDIKPQNILLDDNFNAKVSDFGLSKLIDRDKSSVMTRLRGTPGYLAPEWLTSQITEKVDVFSFGVVAMEIISGRKNLDHSQTEESVHLISILQEKAKNDQLLDMIDKHSNDMHLHRDEVIQMMKLAMWCLQGDSSRRPSMSTVVKVLEGAIDVETRIDYNFVVLTPANSGKNVQLDTSIPAVASVLSGPR